MQLSQTPLQLTPNVPNKYPHFHVCQVAGKQGLKEKPLIGLSLRHKASSVTILVLPQFPKSSNNLFALENPGPGPITKRFRKELTLQKLH